MKRLFAFLFLLLPIYLFAQGFGSFSHDQPFFANSTGIASIPGIPPVLAFHWKASDISSNDPVATWTDRVSGFNLVQTNSLFQPTNDSTYGVCFDGTKSLEFATTLKIPTNSSVFVSGYFSSVPHNQIIVYSTNGNEGLYINATNQVITRYAGNDYGRTSVLNPTNLLTVGYTTRLVSGNLSVVSYTNGILNASNYIIGSAATSFDTVGGWSGRQVGNAYGELDYSLYSFITDIMVWTNAILTNANFVYLNAQAQAAYPSTKTPFFDPNSISGIFHWVRSDNPNTGWQSGGYHTNGTEIQYMPDSVNFTADVNYMWGTANRRPIFRNTLGPNGRSTIQIQTGGAGTYGFGFYSAYTRSQPNTYFFVLQQTNTSSDQDIFDQNYAGNRQMIATVSGGANLRLYAGGSANYVYPRSITNWTILSVCFNGANSWVRTNGVALGSGINPGSNPLQQPLLGSFGGGGNPFLGFISEFMAYNAALNTNDIAKVERFLMDKYDPSTNIWIR